MPCVPSPTSTPGSPWHQKIRNSPIDKKSASFIFNHLERAPLASLEPAGIIMVRDEMSSQAQIDANRRNAQKSTGPTTPEGRDAVRHNALKHGLTSEVLIPMDEKQPDFDLLCDAFITEYQPVGPTEGSLLENLIAAKWRLGRARKEETGFFVKRAIELEHDSQQYREMAANARLAMIVDLDSAGSNTLAKISRYEARLERSFYKALSELRRTQSQREPLETPAAKQTQSEERPPEPAPPPVASEPAPQPQPSEIRHPTSEILQSHSGSVTTLDSSTDRTTYSFRNCRPISSPSFSGFSSSSCSTSTLKNRCVRTILNCTNDLQNLRNPAAPPLLSRRTRRNLFAMLRAGA
jgi:hypothetical protein